MGHLFCKMWITSSAESGVVNELCMGLHHFGKGFLSVFVDKAPSAIMVLVKGDHGMCLL
ncbi:hypothetical protein OAG85_03470 [Verrucomicrobiales bacterium]|nr:hypothetical protein [Verrucomicrobiales bacterium]